MNLCIECFKFINWDIVIAILAFITSLVSVVIAIRSLKNQTMILVYNLFNSKANEINEVILTDSQIQKNISESRVFSLIITSMQQFDEIKNRFSSHILKKDEEMLLKQFYYMLHTTIRSNIWSISLPEDNPTLKQQIIDSRVFLKGCEILDKIN